MSSAGNSSPEEFAGADRRVGVGGWLRGCTVRFGVLYTGLFLVSRATAVMPGSGGIREYYYQFKLKCVTWVARNLLRYEAPIFHRDGYSGDQVYDWLMVITLVGVALIGAAIWVSVDRAMRREKFVAEIVRVVLRYRLGTIMMSYGMIKLLRQQMPEPSMARLLLPFGESSPMELLWVFMGQSWLYCAFSGAAELLGGFLLLFRRTVTLGAVIVAAGMLNVLMMNFAYDVPVKLYTSHYLIFAVALAAPGLRRVVDVFWFRRAMSVGAASRTWNLGPLTRLMPFAKAIVVAWIVWYLPVRRTIEWMGTPRPTRSDLYGIFEVEKFSRNGVETPPLTTDVNRWRRVAFDTRDRVTVVLMDDTLVNLRLGRGLMNGLIGLEPVAGNAAKRQVLNYVFSDGDHLTLTGVMDGVDIAIGLRRADARRLLLREQGFRWISESTLNRWD